MGTSNRRKKKAIARANVNNTKPKANTQNHNSFNIINIPTWIKIVGIVVSLIIFVGNIYYHYYYKRIEAELVVSNYVLEKTIENHKQYLIEIKVKNVGNVNVDLLRAAAYAMSFNPKKFPHKPLFKDHSREQFQDTEVKAGEIKTFKFNAWLDNEFIKEGIETQNATSVDAVILHSRVQAHLTAPNGKYLVASSPDIELVYSQGRQIFLKESLYTTKFEFIDKLPDSYTY